MVRLNVNNRVALENALSNGQDNNGRPIKFELLNKDEMSKGAAVLPRFEGKGSDGRKYFLNLENTTCIVTSMEDVPELIAEDGRKVAGPAELPSERTKLRSQGTPAIEVEKMTGEYSEMTPEVMEGRRLRVERDGDKQRKEELIKKADEYDRKMEESKKKQGQRKQISLEDRAKQKENKNEQQQQQQQQQHQQPDEDEEKRGRGRR